LTKEFDSAFDKAVIVLRYSMSRLVVVIENDENGWLVHESLMQQRNILHSQIDLLLKQKKKFVELSEIQPQLLK
jgi:hypothetical protein